MRYSNYFTRRHFGFRISKSNFLIVCTCLECGVVVVTSVFTVSVERLSTELITYISCSAHHCDIEPWIASPFSILLDSLVEFTWKQRRPRPWENIICRIHLLLNLLVAILVVPAEGEKKCPFKYPVTCTCIHGDMQNDSYTTLVTMGGNSVPVNYNCGSKSLSKNLVLIPLAYYSVCESFPYHLDRDTLLISPIITPVSERIATITVDNTDILGIWRANMKAIRGKDKVEIEIHIQWDIGCHKLVVPFKFEAILKARREQSETSIVFTFNFEASDLNQAFLA